MSEEYKLIHAWVFDPSTPSIFKRKASEKAQLTVISCCNSENCTFFKRKECILLRMVVFSTERCPYGKKSYDVGNTRKSVKFRTWISDNKKKYADVLGALKSAPDVMVLVGDFVYLPYAHLNMNTSLDFKSHGGAFVSGDKFLPVSQFNKTTIMSIVKFRPMAMMGGEIPTYQREVIPEFITHLKEFFPALFKECDEDGCLSKRITNFSNIGRIAYIKTLKIGCKVYKKNYPNEYWIWDGTYLTTENQSLSFPITREYDKLEMKMTPSENGTIEITSNDQVDENTRFLK